MKHVDRIRAAAENLLRFRGELADLTQDQIRDDRHAGHRYP